MGQSLPNSVSPDGQLVFTDGGSPVYNLLTFAVFLLRESAFYVLYVSRQLLDRALNALFTCLYRQLRPRPAPLPAPRRALLSLSASRLAHKIRTRQLTSEQVVGTFAVRLRELEPELRCLRAARFEEALAEARAADAEIAALREELLAESEDQRESDWTLLARLQARRPLLGVPFTARAPPPSGGRETETEAEAEAESARAVAALRDAGAILLATTVGGDSLGWRRGEALLPHDRRRPTGDGGAALVAAAGIPLAVGADVGGGLRAAAAFCGLFSHCASPDHTVATAFGSDVPAQSSSDPAGLESEISLREKREATDHLETQLGPLSRHAEDLRTAARLLARGPVSAGRLREVVPAEQLRVFTAALPALLATSAPQRPVRRAVLEAAGALRSRGAEVRSTQLPEAEHALAIVLACLRAEQAADPQTASLVTDLATWPLGGRHLTLPSLLRRILGASYCADGLRWRARLRRRLGALLGADGVLLYPAHPTPAPLPFHSASRPLDLLPSALVWALQLPTCVVPCGCDDAGLPLAVQVVAAPGGDHLCLAVAEVLHASPGFVSPEWDEGQQGVANSGHRAGRSAAGILADGF